MTISTTPKPRSVPNSTRMRRRSTKRSGNEGEISTGILAYNTPAMNAVDVPVRETSTKRWVLWAGRAISLWPAFVVISSATWKLTRNPWYVKEFARIGWPESALNGLAFLQLGCLALYLIPPTAVLGAVLLT